MPNRDFWSRPVQSDRTSHAYGHTRLHKPRRPLWYSAAALALFLIIVLLESNP